jgi:hypothetical protein
MEKLKNIEWRHINIVILYGKVKKYSLWMNVRYIAITYIKKKVKETFYMNIV